MMDSRRKFVQRVSACGIAGILAAGKAPAFAKDMGMLKIGQIGIGHNFALRFNNPDIMNDNIRKCKPYAFWYDVPQICERFKSKAFQKISRDPVELVKESDVISIEHPDFRKTLEFAQPALEMGKPVFVERPFTDTIYSAEEMVRLAKEHNAPLMSTSSLELQPQLPEIRKWAEDNCPIRSYVCNCPEPMFVWMFPHAINFAHAALGGGIDTAYFSGDYISNILGIKNKPFECWYDDNRPLGSAVSILKYKSRDGQPPIIGTNQIGPGPGTYNIDIYCVKAHKNFVVGEHLDDPKIFQPVMPVLADFFVERKIPRPYEALLEQHRALVATNVSRLTGRDVKLDSLGALDALPYSPTLKQWLDNLYI